MVDKMMVPTFLAAGFNPLSFDPAAFVLTLVTFLGLLLILTKFAWGPILKSIEARETRIDDAIAQAEADRKTAEGVLADYREQVKNVESEVAALKEKGRQEAEAVAREVKAKADAEAVQRIERAVKEIAQAQSQALEEIRTEAVGLGMAVASQVVGRNLDNEEQRRLATEVVEWLGKVGSAGDN
jgi:F-type H+-transporting ATPase subunit b